MRRFIKTITVRRHVQFTVVQDGDTKTFSILRWAADGEASEPAAFAVPELVVSFEYQPGDDCDVKRGLAVAEAGRLAAAEKAGREAVFGGVAEFM